MIYVIFYGCASNPEIGDETKGWTSDPVEAKAYCELKNMMADKEYSYWYEEVKHIDNHHED